jgi:hypothetical protein
VPTLSRAIVDEAAHFDAKFDDWSVRTLLDTLIIDTLAIHPERLQKDHLRDVLVGEIFATRRAWGMSPAQVVIYLELSNRSR